MKRASLLQRFDHWLNANKSLRDRMVGFGVSCCLHVLLLLTLSLIAIGTGALEGSVVFESATAEVNEEPMLAADTQWLLVPDLPDVSTEDRPIEFELADLEAHAPTLDRTTDIPTSSEPIESPAEETKKSASRAGKGSGSGLEGMQAMAAAGIQTRVSKAGGKRGEVQFALAWRNVNDLDLHVITPSGERISHQYRRSQCGGVLDVDMNVEGESEQPVENVRWLRNAPLGRYTILVNFFRLNSEGVRRPKHENPYQLLAQLGNESAMREAVATFGEKQVTVWRFTYVPDSFSSLEREQILERFAELQKREETLAAPMLEKALAAEGAARKRSLLGVIQHYPHTDAAIKAMQSLGGEVVKRRGKE